jgi:hypothetical protein
MARQGGKQLTVDSGQWTVDDFSLNFSGNDTNCGAPEICGMFGRYSGKMILRLG